MIQYECFIPMPDPVYQLSDMFRKHGFVLHAVGGVVRDFLLNKNEYEQNPELFRPKDVDLCTNARPEQIHALLEKEGVSNFGKGASFGVWVAHLDGEDFEIATFREDIGVSDGRHPESIRFCTAKEDSARRDLTINALYYLIPEREYPGVILDFGTGLQDVVQKVVRVVGNPFDRFNEDKLRILRFLRFHCRFSDEEITPETIGSETWNAIQHYKDLRGLGVSGPRIMAEVTSGINQSRRVSKFFLMAVRLGLWDALFPKLYPELDKIEFFDKQPRTIPVVLAHILRNHGSNVVRQRLNELNYPNEVSDEVAFLIRSYYWLMQNWESASPAYSPLVKISLEMDKTEERRINFISFGHSVGEEIDHSLLAFMKKYIPRKYDGCELMKDYGLEEGPELGRKIQSLHLMDFTDALSLTKSSELDFSPWCPQSE